MAVPLGPRQMIGVVLGLTADAPTGKALRDVAGRFDMPPLTPSHRKFVDWLSAYYLEPPGNVLAHGAPGAGAPSKARASRSPIGPPKRFRNG